MAPDRAARAALIAAGGACLLAACGPADDAFRVVDSTPAAGAPWPEDGVARVVFSESVDPDTCTPATVFLARVGPWGHATPRTDRTLVVEAVDEVALTGSALPAGAWRLGVQSGPGGCLSQWGRGIEPFALDFQVGD